MVPRLRPRIWKCQQLSHGKHFHDFYFEMESHPSLNSTVTLDVTVELQSSARSVKLGSRRPAVFPII